MVKKKSNQASLKQLVTWSAEAQLAAQDWRADSWQDYEFRDGKQWTKTDLARMEKMGIRALTINRTFPVLNLLQGQYLNNPGMITAKGRTKKDSEMGQVMSESLMFVGDQCQGPRHKKRAFEQAITAGVGFLETGFNSDPRKEKVCYFPRNWYSIWWDPYSTPWMPKETCRYAFSADWSNLDDVATLFPEKASDLREHYKEMSVDDFVPDLLDEGTQIEDMKRFAGSTNWANSSRNRIRPIEMWYTAIDKGFFAKMPDGRVIDLDTLPSPNDEYEVIQRASEVLTANVKKMRVASFIGNLLLQDIPTPYVHDDYPYVPYIGYLDRYDQPFGVPRQIKEQDGEVNKRRSMSLALMSSRRVRTEDGAASEDDMNALQREANRLDGFMVMKKGKLDRIVIEDMGVMAPAQMDILNASEREIQEISGGQDVNPQSNIRSTGMMEKQQSTSAAITASLLDNAKMSDKMLGEKLMALIQDTWTDEKVLRVTDRVTGTEKFVAVNERYLEGTSIKVRNDLTQARFDIVSTAVPMTDTMREKNMENIFAAINKAPEEAIGPLINLAMEISDLPNKDELLAQIRKATGVPEIDDSLTTDEKELQAKQEAEAQQVQQAKEQQAADLNVQLEQDQTAAETEKIRAETQVEIQKVKIAQQDVDQKGFQVGSQAAQMMHNNETDGPTRSDQAHSKNPKPKGPNNDKGATK